MFADLLKNNAVCGGYYTCLLANLVKNWSSDKVSSIFNKFMISDF